MTRRHCLLQKGDEHILNKKLITAIFIVLLFIPSFVAIGYYSSTKAGVKNESDVKSLKIEDLDGVKRLFSSEDKTALSSDMITLFYNMISNATEVPSLPEAMKNKFFKVTFSSFGEEFVYQFHFTTNPSEAYYVDSLAMKVYKIGEEYASTFLTKECAVSLYDSVPPVMILGGEGGHRISPSSLSWNYKTYNGEFVPLDPKEFLAAENDASYTIDGGFDLSFTEAPDSVMLTIKANDTEIFHDTIEHMDQLSFGDAKEFEVVVSAEWFESTEKHFKGTATYTFNGKLVEPAAFYLGQETISNGEFVVIAGKNVSSPSEITFASNPSIDYTPVFYKEGDFVYALVPIRYELEDGTDKTYEFTIGYHGTSQKMNLTVKSYKYKSSTLDIPSGVESATYTEESRTEAENALHALAKTETLNVHAFSGTFYEDVVGPNSADLISPGFGRMIKIKSSGTTFRHTGCDYKIAGGKDVFAVNAGTVVYSGYLTLTGNIVVIDHGWGLKSWYCHLSESSVKVGDTIKRGGVIGKTGDTGFTTSKRIHVGLTVGDVPVCIYPLFDNQIAIPDLG